MRNTETGNHAFPTQEWLDVGDGRIAHYQEEGMSLRDYFAAKALSKIGMFPDTLKLDIDGRMTSHQKHEFNKYAKAAAKLAYELADAMLVERVPK